MKEVQSSQHKQQKDEPKSNIKQQFRQVSDNCLYRYSKSVCQQPNKFTFDKQFDISSLLNKRKPNLLYEALKNNQRNKTFSETDKMIIRKQDKQQSIPRPLDSQQELSKEAQYFSYYKFGDTFDYPDRKEPETAVNQTGDVDDSFSSKFRKQELEDYDRSIFINILCQAAIYLRKDKRTQIDDKLMFEILKQHLQTKNFCNPLSKTTIGYSLKTNGYIVAAYCLCFGRLNKSKLYCQTAFDAFNRKISTIQENVEQFMRYYNIVKRDIKQLEIPQQNLKRQRMSERQIANENQNQNENMKETKCTIKSVRKTPAEIEEQARRNQQNARRYRRA